VCLGFGGMVRWVDEDYHLQHQVVQDLLAPSVPLSNSGVMLLIVKSEIFWDPSDPRQGNAGNDL
jgi:hypothetical protein